MRIKNSFFMVKALLEPDMVIGMILPIGYVAQILSRLLLKKHKSGSGPFRTLKKLKTKANMNAF